MTAFFEFGQLVSPKTILPPWQGKQGGNTPAKKEWATPPAPPLRRIDAVGGVFNLHNFSGTNWQRCWTSLAPTELGKNGTVGANLGWPAAGRVLCAVIPSQQPSPQRGESRGLRISKNKMRHGKPEGNHAPRQSD